MPENETRVNVAAGPEGQTCATRGTDAPVLVYATFPGADEARRIGIELVEMRLAACVNILAGMVSVYRWQGTTHADAEAVAIIKTRSGLAERVIGVLRVRHSYRNPAVVVVPVAGGSAEFLDWILSETA